MTFRRSLALCALLLVAAVAQGASYPVPGHGALQLSVPAGWTATVREVEGALPPTIVLAHEKDGTRLLLTPLWSPKDNASFNSAKNVRLSVQQAAEQVQPTAVEKELTLREVVTSSGKGTFFWATDRAPKAGEYEYVAQGAVPAGKLMVSFTILTHRAPPAGIDEALAIVRSAVHQP
ncbi:MAG TPA: hypothetical protein VGF69_08060 [Thermoanaerobaculia bacterium]|jgi:hypothetical protein